MSHDLETYWYDEQSSIAILPVTWRCRTENYYRHGFDTTPFVFIDSLYQVIASQATTYSLLHPYRHLG